MARDFFQFLNFIKSFVSKSKGEEDLIEFYEENKESLFMIERWLSMGDGSVLSKIAKLSPILQSKELSDSQKISLLYYALPKVNKFNPRYVK